MPKNLNEAKKKVIIAILNIFSVASAQRAVQILYDVYFANISSCSNIFFNSFLISKLAWIV